MQMELPKPLRIIKSLHEKSHVKKNFIGELQSHKTIKSHKWESFSLQTLYIPHTCLPSENSLWKPDIGSEAVWESLEQKKSSIMSCFAYGSNTVWRNSLIPQYHIFCPNYHLARAFVLILFLPWRRHYGPNGLAYSAYHLPKWSQQQMSAQLRIFPPTPVFPFTRVSLQTLKQRRTADLVPGVQVLPLRQSYT